MTGDARATLRVPCDDPETVAAAVRPDDTDEMETRVEDDAVVAHIERATAGGLRSTADDCVVNLTVATDIAAIADRHDTNL
jgi:hypothetical protein